ncbi:DNA repair protein RAD51 homolog 3-like [Venturia canescens]|uniref:DNA repair protein RAD51 homolog 3-like n=1 Tax=Venturia canescens TaxID=32260 RepID=UPI001C9C4DD0|nr:DNA repair protein RAD51 homolog 3-like [Venturia canescens]
MCTRPSPNRKITKNHKKMMQPISTLKLSKSAKTELAKSGYHYVDDIENLGEWTRKHNEKLTPPLPPEISALDLWQDEVQQDYVRTFCENLDNILDGGFRCGTITEICGAYGSGKTQICFQTSVNCQLPQNCGGLSSQTLYIDTRNGFSSCRIQDIIRGCQKRFPNVILNENDILKEIKVSSPRNLDELISTIHSLKKYLRTDSKIKAIILDSLSLPVQCTLTDGWQRTQFYFRVVDELQKIASRNKIAVIIVNELCSHVDDEGEITYESAGGQLFAHRALRRLVVTRLSDSRFAARILKSSSVPQISIKFHIDEDGIRDENSSQ